MRGFFNFSCQIMAQRSDPNGHTPPSPKVLDRDGVLSVMGYKGEVKELATLKYLPEEREGCFK